MSNSASKEARQEALKAKHEALDEAIHEEMQRPKPDDTKIASLKKQKLAIKAELEA